MKSQLGKLQKLVGHANTYGVQFWADDNENIPDTAEIDTSKLKKSGRFYTVKIPKTSSTNYTSLCAIYDSVFENAGYSCGLFTIGTGYTFAKGTHLCNCLDIVKCYVINRVTNSLKHFSYIP